MFLEGPNKEVDARCRSWKGTPYDCYRVPLVHSKVLPVVGVQGRICDVPSGSCGGHSVAALLAFHIAMFLEVPKKEVETWCQSWKGTPYDCYRVTLVHSKVLPVVGVQGRICDVPGGPVEDTVWQLCWLSTLLCSWRAPRKKWRHDVGHERVPPMTVTGSHWFIVRYFQLWGCKELGRICDVPGVLWRIQCGSFAGFHIAMFLEGPKKEVNAWCRSWKGTPIDCYRVPPVCSTVFPVVGVQGQTCDVPGGPVEDTMWQLCWLSTLLCSWRAPRKKWRHDVGHERVPPMTVTGSHRFIIRYFQLWGCKELGRICDVPGVLWRIQCGSFAGFHIAMFLEGPQKEVDARCRSWKGTPYDCDRVPPVHSKVLPVVGVQGRICDVPWGSCEGDSVAALLAFHIAMFLEGPPKEVEIRCRSWKCTPYDCYRVPPVHSKVLPVVGVQGRICDVPGGPVEDTVGQFCWLPHCYVHGGPQKRSGGTMSVMKGYPLWL